MRPWIAIIAFFSIGMANPGEAHAAEKFKTCVNVWGSLVVPADQPCRAGVDTQYLSSPRAYNAPTAARPPMRRGHRKFKTCVNVWGSLEVPVDQPCRAGVDTQYLSSRKAANPPIQRPRSALRRQQKRFKTCINVWGALEVPADQPCRAGVDTQYLNP